MREEIVVAKLKDIADYVGVSISTVSRVINHDESRTVNEETRKKIWDAAHAIGYKTKQAEKSAKSKKEANKASFRLGCVVAVPQNKYNHPYFSVILEGIERGLQAEGYRLEFLHSMGDGGDVNEIKRLVKDHAINGMIVVEGIDADIYAWIKKHVRVVVGIDIADPEVPVVAYDRVSAAKAAVRHLIARGHRHIGFIGGVGLGGNIEREKRYKGYKEAMEEEKLAIDPDWVINVNWDVSQSYEIVKQALLQNKQRPTAFFSASDMMAIPAMRAVTELQLAIPGDIAFFSVDDIEFSAYTSPPLSTIFVPKLDMGRVAANLLIDYLNQKYNIPVKVYVPYELKLRQSSGEN